MPPGLPQVRYSGLRHPIRTLEARAAKDPGLRKAGKWLKYLAPVLTSGAFAAIFAATPGVSTITGLLVWALVGAVPSGLTSWAVSEGFKNAGAERKLAPFNQVIAKLLRDKKVEREELEIRGVDVSGISEAIVIRERLVYNKILGMGGMAVTLRVHDTRLDMNKALKVPLPELLTNPEAFGRFVAEAKGLVRLRNKRIVGFYDLEYMRREAYVELLDCARDYAVRETQQGEFEPNLAALEVEAEKLPEKIPYIHMEFIEGSTLEEQITGGVMPVADALKVGIELVEALKYIQARNVVHRDLKPENVFIVVDPDNPNQSTVKIIDFGLIKTIRPATDASKTDAHLTRLGAAMGTPTWMSPEQIAGVKDIDWRTDLYAVGLLIYHMLSWRLPFKGWDTIETVYDVLQYNEKVLRTQPLDIRRAVDGVPDSLANILNRMLATDREQRYQSPEDCLNALKIVYREILGQAPTAVVRIGPDGQIIR